MLFNGRALIFTLSRTQVRIAEIERLQSLFKMSMHRPEVEFRGTSVTDFNVDYTGDSSPTSQLATLVYTQPIVGEIAHTVFDLISEQPA